MQTKIFIILNLFVDYVCGQKYSKNTEHLMNENSRLNQILKMIEEEPQDAFLQFAAALEYEKMGQYDQALSYFKKLLTTHPSYTATYLHLGKLYLKQGNISEAKQTFEAGMRLSRGKEPKTYQELSAALEDIEDFNNSPQ
jgi:tetratricopeptide (TPR) repeat protein